ncbi:MULTISPECIES: 2-octaprenyl-6-methoxyphenyl hydroxylase [unclassified Wolbachia]|uniref:2-octaprenyl-6-methoxyphenyl hydroxylase n=1 Tax=unclassified Wolbachia TaxID=2640676 RepID=UPI001AE51EC8|nr:MULTISPECIES: 2-octaprenyl-6-methoxyphenyl hydroxylase [unclassified Wolbachia]MDX5496722.1 2-octaprenyl-6-methoxyphenyl hydroxylase [Wolbachia endosymbiont of Nomada fabriciana]MDX5528258.1 2-octaprenyl-6-methoxyphenyl hydroxylase [Wolbachia endosymbiont of Andrena minutula]MEC4734495.1 2-octaprenyl-6-methoxyphenyl hydroxylase [Wolbachia endosymbiont of Halictus tumulorum]QTP61799.1 2-octaprenyl-6-methoxyphenyl hydroxylase [Wolbachia endosymbiont of Wiebesia pumilae]
MNYDVIISGGGLLGLITAIGLSCDSVSVAVIEKNSLPRVVDDNRAFAISQGSKKILEKLGIWQFIESEAEPILDICILDAVTVHYNHKMVGEEPMGYVINNATIWNAINNNFLNKLNIYSPHSYKTIACDSGYVEVILDNNQELISSLLICAEGKNSKLPELFSIPTAKFDYKQSSIVFNVKHELHHQNLAVERFFPGGPFAILPIKDGYTSSIVWTEKSGISKMLMDLSEEEFIIELKKRFGSYLGKIKLEGERKLYPLSFVFAKKLYKGRVLLIGDAAHSIHPVAGQGLNLGIRDVESIIKHVVAAKASGIDVGSSYLLKKISRNRYFDNFTMALATDGLNRMFSNRIFCAKALRNLGLIAVENSNFLKKRFIRHAMGFI